jgi:hypothetical protein
MAIFRQVLSLRQIEQTPMYNPLTSSSTMQQTATPLHKPGRRFWRISLVALGVAIAIANPLHSLPGQAQSVNNAPAEVKSILTAIDTAASNQNIQKVLQFYAPTFTHSDGLTRQTLEQALTNFWKQYSNLTYTTELKSWKPQGKGFLTETVTRITGTQKVGDREWKIDATLRAQQRLENQKIVRQEILAERSEVTSGTKPPVVKVNLPEQVIVDQEFAFDAIVQEPLGTDMLLGTALEEPVKPGGLLKPTLADLELLSAGGIFKVGRAPRTPEPRWLSAVLVRQEGITLITQRLRVVDRKK